MGATDRRSEQESRWAVPVLRAVPGAPPSRSRAPGAAPARGRLLRRAVLRLRAAGRGVRAARTARDRCARARRRHRAHGPERDRVAGRGPNAVPDGRLGGRLGRRRRAAAADPRRRDRPRLRRAAPVADRRLRGLRARRRVRHLPRDLAARPARAARPCGASRTSRRTRATRPGHTAASIAVYGGLALLLTSAIPSRALRRLAWGVAVVLPLIVAASRMYRGMHHPLDVAGGVLVGVGAVLVLLFACRAAAAPPRAGARAEPRRGREPEPRAGGVGRSPSSPTPTSASAAGCPSCAACSPRAASRIRSGSRCPRPSRRPSRCAGRSTRAPTSSSPGAATAPSAAASASSPGEDARLAVIPAGTANLLRDQPRHPGDIERAVAIGLRGARRRLDVGRFDGERFAVMAGVGFDAAMIRDADDLKDRIGRARTCGAARATSPEASRREIAVDGDRLVRRAARPASCSATSASCSAASRCSPTREPDDGRLELGVVTAEGVVQWARTLARTAAGDPARSPFVRVTKAEAVKVELDRKVRYELDGGDRTKSSRSRSRRAGRAAASASRARRGGE